MTFLYAFVLFTLQHKISNSEHDYCSAVVVYTPIDVGNNTNRTIPSEMVMRIASHSTFLKENYRNGINSYLTLSGLSPDTEITLYFLEGAIDSEDCSNYVEIFGVGATVNGTKLCSFSPHNTVILTTTKDIVTFRFYTDPERVVRVGGVGAIGFLFSYTGKNSRVILFFFFFCCLFYMHP